MPQKKSDFPERSFRGVVDFISKNRVQTTPEPKPGDLSARSRFGDMHSHYVWQNLRNAFDLGGPNPSTLDEGDAQAQIAGLIDQIRQANQLPPNWDPRDVNLPTERPSIARELMRRQGVR